MVEGGDQPDLLRKQHAVAENVARHVADTDDGEGLALDVAVHFAEMALDRFPGAARRNADLLVIVAGRAAGGEGVVEPEMVRLADRVRRVGEGRRALVGGDDEIGIVAVMAHDILRRRHLRAMQIVGNGKQARNEIDVGVPAGFEDRITVAGREALGIEAALGADRYDAGVLDLLRLDEAEDFRAVVLRPVRPAYAAARHRPEAQMHALHLRAVDEYFAPWPRTRQALNCRRIELQRQRAGLLLQRRHEVIGSQRTVNEVEETPENRVFVEIGDIFQRALDFRHDRRLVGPPPALRIEARDEQAMKLAGDVGMAGKHGGDIVLALRNARLLQIAAIGAQDHDIGGGKAGPVGECVVAVIVAGA